MSEAIIIAILVAIPPTIASVAAVLTSLRNTHKIQAIHVAMNSRFDQWMLMTQAASHAEGVKDEKERASKKDSPT